MSRLGSLAKVLIDRLGAVGARPEEGSNERLGRQLLVFGGTAMSLGGVVWGSLALAFDAPAPSLVPWGYVVITVINLSRLSVTKNFPRARVTQVLASLALPFLFQFALGGIISSGMVMLWAMIALVGSLTFSTAKESVLWLFIYCALAVVSGMMDSFLSAHRPFDPPQAVVRLFFTVNVVMISAIVFGLAIALNERQRRAITALEQGERTNRTLAAQLQVLTANLEGQVKTRTQELEAALVHAEAGTRAKSDFLATMSHEIRTPLNGILGTTQLLRLSPLAGQQREYVDLIQRSGALLMSVLNDVLDFSKIEAGRLELVPRPFELLTEFETVVGLHRAGAAEHGVVMRLEPYGELPRLVVADPDRLAQILGNLLSNAVKFTAAGSIVVHLRVTLTEGGGGWLDFEVADTGVGIAADAAERLFRPFTQADSSTTRRYGGTGLGLAISARLAERMGGAISVSSEPGRGSTFRVRTAFEACRSPVTMTPTPKPPELAAGRATLTVLLAEDNPINQTIGANLLRHLGCEVLVANNGAEAVELVRTKSVELVLMDLQMPVLDGLEATKRILELGLRQSPRIVALTANAFESDRQACLAAGMHDFLTKPLRLDLLKQQLRLAQASPRQVA